MRRPRSMRLKLYCAATMSEAMARVRAELGPDALILASRRVAEGVELSAAVEDAPLGGDGVDLSQACLSAGPAPTIAPHTDPAAIASNIAPRRAAIASAPRPPPLGRASPRGAATDVPAQQLPPRAVPHPAGNVAPSHTARVGAPTDRQRTAAFAWHRLPPHAAERLRAGPLPFALSVAFRFATLDFSPNAVPLLLAGPPGAGKTLTTARLATRLVLAGVRPLIITADGRRAGAAEQLAAFTRLLGLHLLVASSPSALARALDRREAEQPVLVDMPGLDPFDAGRTEELTALAAIAGGTVVLVLPAGLDTEEAADLAHAYREAGARLMVANRLDAARRLGGVFAAAETGLALTEAGIGPGAADGLIPLTPDLLATRLLHVPERPA